MRQPKMYLVRFKSKGDGFIGWNSVYAISLPDAKKKLLDKCGQKFFERIIQAGRLFAEADKLERIFSK